MATPASAQVHVDVGGVAPPVGAHVVASIGTTMRMRNCSFVPDSADLPVASPLLNAREPAVIAFDAPAEPGDYPFVCSFPGP